MLPMAMNPSASTEYFQVTRHGDIGVIVPSPEVERLPEDLIRQAADMILVPLKQDPPGSILVDLSAVNYFGSAFISLLLRLHLFVKNHGSELVLTGASEACRELLRNTALDTLWAVYDTRKEAMLALAGSD